MIPKSGYRFSDQIVLNIEVSRANAMTITD
jgi:hypothetical protein